MSPLFYTSYYAFIVIFKIKDVFFKPKFKIKDVFFLTKIKDVTTHEMTIECIVTVRSNLFLFIYANTKTLHRL